MMMCPMWMMWNLGDRWHSTDRAADRSHCEVAAKTGVSCGPKPGCACSEFRR